MTTIMPVTPRPDKNESQQKFKFFKSRKESTTVHRVTAQTRLTGLTSINSSALKSEQVQTLREPPRVHMRPYEFQLIKPNEGKAIDLKTWDLSIPFLFGPYVMKIRSNWGKLTTD